MKFIEFVAIIKSINLAITIRMKNDYAIIVVRHRWSFVSLIFTSFNFIKLHSMNSFAFIIEENLIIKKKKIVKIIVIFFL